MKSRAPAWLLVIASFLASCASERPVAPVTGAASARDFVDRSLPSGVADRAGWAADIYAGLTAQALEPSHENVCAVAAVIAQESGFQVDPVVPGMAAIAWREIDKRAEHAGVPQLILRGALQVKSSTGRTYSDRIDAAKTEKDLSDIFEDFIGRVPMGRTLFADHNPIRTRGPMQVNVAFVEHYATVRPYPYPVRTSLADEAFTRRGSVYFGAAHLLAYPAAYDDYRYRFADYNAGQYASRNAAFQNALSGASGLQLTPDGALLPHDADINNPGSTELAVRGLAGRLGISAEDAHHALELGRSKDFERTSLYTRVFALAEPRHGRPLPRAVVPRITLQGPKIKRHLTTEWYADRVNQRFKRCMLK